MTDRDKPNASRDSYHTLDVGADAADEEITRAYWRLSRSHRLPAGRGHASTSKATADPRLRIDLSTPVEGGP